MLLGKIESFMKFSTCINLLFVLKNLNSGIIQTSAILYAINITWNLTYKLCSINELAISTRWLASEDWRKANVTVITCKRDGDWEGKWEMTSLTSVPGKLADWMLGQNQASGEESTWLLRVDLLNKTLGVSWWGQLVCDASNTVSLVFQQSCCEGFYGN